MKLTKKEQKESLFMTFGRIRSIVHVFGKDQRLTELVEKLSKDLKNARIEENIFN